jgi:hypothetical protein
VTGNAAQPPSRLLDGLISADRARATNVLAGASTIELEAGVPHFAAAFGRAALLVVEEGFVVIRAASAPALRSVVTVDAGPGAILLPPTLEEVLSAIGPSRVTALSAQVRDQLLAVPGVAQRVVEEFVVGLAQRQESLSNFAPTRHRERVRRKLLQLARAHGHVVHDGVRIDFPISHALLAEMIGSSRETVTRALDELQRSGFAARTGSTYRLLVPADAVFRDLALPALV